MSIDIAHNRGAISRSSKRVGAGLEEVGQIALGVDLADERALAASRGQPGQGGRDGGLADAALAGDEDQLAFEQIDQALARPVLADRGAEADPAVLAAGIELDVGHPVAAGTPTRRPRRSVSHSTL